ncbi:hypothetical protein PAP_05205 [Palaeococcus pacificus DY20341]|uniref:Uncharacterized protein n=1 Tax=Palaeococcus pacificus DY20341 TaxID=1343739 RepID=A0A075LU06_9EURY|nr:hypothetical protein [Palaeococcus pacificus]AIF69452.1 hypothetical protein PAP_05205 [Palaeococcus pacificus DY20341]
MQEHEEKYEREKQKLQEWFLGLIGKFREEYDKLSDEEKFFVGNTGYQAPCQIEVFWVNEPLEWQIIIITHDSTRKDMEVIINGPYKGYEFFPKLEKIMNEERWERTIPPDSPYYGAEKGTIKYSDIFVGILSNFRQQIESLVFSRIPKGLGMGISFPSNGWCQLVYGRIDELTQEEIIARIIDDAKRNAREHREEGKVSSTAKPKKKEERLKGYGTYVYPPVWVGEAPEFSFVQKVMGNNFFIPKIVLKTKFNNKPLIIRSDGFVGIVHENKEDVLKWINVIFGTALLLDKFSCYFVRESEIASIEVNPTTMEIAGMRIPLTTLRTYQVDPIVSKHVFHLKREKVIPKEDIKEAIKIAELISKNKELADEIIFLLSGFTHYQEHEYQQAFIATWIVIEKYLSQLWENFIRRRNLSKRRREKLTNSLLWRTDHILETLNLTGKLDEDVYRLLMDLKSKRNKFIHEGKPIKKEDAGKVLSFAILILREEIKKITGDFHDE